MSSDRAKLNLKDRLEQHESDLEAYTRADDPELPGYTFLTPAVVDAYGICPYLDVFKSESVHDQRERWLKTRPDQGEIYWREREQLLDNPADDQLEREHEAAKEELTRRVQETIDAEITLDPSLIRTYADLLEAFWTCKRSKSVNKQMKQLKTKIGYTMDAIAVASRGVDFNRFMSTVHGVQMKYKPPTVEPNDDDGSESGWFADLCARCAAIKSQRERNATMRMNAKQTAMARLVELIGKQFKTPQTGKYFQKWSSLPQDKRLDRIHSYCEWYTRENGLPSHAASTLCDFVLEKIQSKELRVSDIRWETKRGIISRIDGIVLGGEGNGEADVPGAPTFSLEKRTATKARKGQSKKKRDDLFQTPEQKEIMKRAHRLLLYEIVSSQVLNKEQIVQNVMYNVNVDAHDLPHGAFASYIGARFDDMVEQIRAYSAARRSE